MPVKPYKGKRVIKKSIDDDDFKHPDEMQKYEKMDFMHFEAVKKVEITVDRLRINFTAEENMKAYRLFQIMDLDGGGTVDLREIKRGKYSLISIMCFYNNNLLIYLYINNSFDGGYGKNNG